MTDIFTPQKRSEIMSRIHSSGTDPEKRMFAILRVILGKRRRIDVNRHDLPGQPDILIPSLSIAVFVDGCFYHSCPVHGHLPKSRLGYWGPKFRQNLARDRANRRALRLRGYSVWRFWEHDLKAQNVNRTIAILRKRVLARIPPRASAP